MKTVVMADVHNYIDTAQFILDSEDADEYVFLGDIFDSFFDTEHIALKTAKWLETILNRDDCVVTWGNHDVPYRYTMNKWASCPGFNHEKCRAINSAIHYLWDKFKWYYKTQGWYISHAGLHEDIFCHPVKGFSDEELDKVIEKGITHLNSGVDANHCRMGLRMGFGRVGGCTWADWDEFKPIEGVNQIVGHTPHACARVKYLKKHRSSHKQISIINSIFENQKPSDDKILSLNYCIDCGGHKYAVIQDGKVEIKQNTMLIGKGYQS